MFALVRKQLAFNPKKKSYIFSLYSNINIGLVPKKIPSDAILRCLKPCIKSTNIKCLKVAPKFFAKRTQPAAALVQISHVRLFHMTCPLRAPPALILVILRPLVKLAAIIFGRTLRKWWQTLPPEKKQEILRKVHSYRAHITGVLTVMSLTMLHFYFSHLEQDPITNRWRFIIFSREQMKQIADLEQEVLVEQYQDIFLNANDAEFRQVFKVANRILTGNQDVQALQDTKWQLTVVDHPSLRNAFVLPNGTIFIFKGMVELCDNEDQLGIILAHEMSHAVLGHMAEQMSNVQLIEWLLIIPLVIVWALMPDGAALISQWLSGQFANLLFHLPFSRSIEKEADKFGLQFAAKACFDVREATVFWNKMSEVDKESGEDGRAEWLSTHPNHDTRERFLQAMMPQILKLRAECDCPPLPTRDPRAVWDARKKRIAKMKKDLVDQK